jgi:hypothetical protein
MVRLDIAKKKADEESRQKSAQLVEMHMLDERTRLMLDATPLGANFWDRNLKNIDCNMEAVKLFGLKDKQEYLARFHELSPEYQPDGGLTSERTAYFLNKAFEEGYERVEWMHRKLDGELIPCEVTLVRVKYKDDFIVLAYTRDLREYKQMLGVIERRDNLLRTVNRAASIILTTDDEENFEELLLSGMKLIGRSLDVDRVQIWQNETIDGLLHFVHRYEWLSDVGKCKPSVPIGLKFAYSEKPEWEQMFLRGEYINSPLSGLPPSDQDFLSYYGMKSIVIIPLFLQDRFWGFFSVDECCNERAFTEEEIHI